MVKRRLPMLERSLSTVEAARIDGADRFDRAVKAEAAKAKTAVTCRPGCNGCCHHPVTISLLEGILLYRHLKQAGLWSSDLKEKLAGTAERQTGATYEVWLLSAQPCGLLTQDGLCGAWSARPLVCRTYVSTGDPHFCHPHRLGQQTRIADRTKPVEAYHKFEAKALKALKLEHLLMPIGVAVLLAERIESGEVDITNADREAIRQYNELA